MSIKIEIKHKGVSVWITERTVTKNGKQYSEYVVPDYTSGKRVRHVRATEKDAKAKAREVSEARATGNSIERRVIVDDNLRHDVRRLIVLLEPFGVDILAGTRKLVDVLKVLERQN